MEGGSHDDADSEPEARAANFIVLFLVTSLFIGSGTSAVTILSPLLSIAFLHALISCFLGS